MPDSLNFDVLPRWGVKHYRCVECGWPEEAKHMNQQTRERHHDKHAQEREQEIQRKRVAALVKARKARQR